MCYNRDLAQPNKFFKKIHIYTHTYIDPYTYENGNSSWLYFAAAAAKSLQSCPTLCDPTDGSPPGSPIPGILQARTLEWVAISFANAWKWKVKVKSCLTLSDPMDCSPQAPPSMGFSRQEYWSGVPLPSPWHTTKDILMRHTKDILHKKGPEHSYSQLCAATQPQD